MKTITGLLLSIMFLILFGVIYAKGYIGVYSIEPRYDRDWYASTRYYHYGAYYIYGEVKGWYVPGIPGYYSSEHYGYASMGGNRSHENRVKWIKICGRAFDQNGNRIVRTCTDKIYSTNSGVSVDGYISIDYGVIKAYKVQTKVITHYHHYHNSYYYNHFNSTIPYSYVEVNY